MTEQKFKTEEFRVEGEKLIAKIKELIHEGTIRRIIIKDKEGKTVMEIPMTFGVVGVLIAPQLAAIGAIAALLTEATVVVEKADA
ncbi:MAG TPA: DUF4342 domain-containing protein [Anaerolineales bacterium]|jgi:hypothetical protein|nr:DUF4342 domain-containing protein [Anaerolineales bacterium]